MVLSERLHPAGRGTETARRRASSALETMNGTHRSVRSEIARDWKILVAIVVPITILSCIAAAAFPFLRQLENWSRDFRIVTLMPSTPQSADIVLVLITEDTLA